MLEVCSQCSRLVHQLSFEPGDLWLIVISSSHSLVLWRARHHHLDHTNLFQGALLLPAKDGKEVQ